MPILTANDNIFMQLALTLAKQGIYTTPPNPNVGCVLVKDGQIVGQGFHIKAGMPHAEVMALREAGENARGATAYVTLEPCSHFGRTPPCANALIKAGVKRVVSAMVDPNPQVAGKGLARLQEAGIETTVGLCQEEAECLNRNFFTRIRTGKPFVQLKMAMSLDGRTAMANGESQWISNALSRTDVQCLRARSGAILSSSATVLRDDPLLNVRWEQLPEDVKSHYPLETLRQPVRVILDNHHQIPSTARLFQIPTPVWLVSHKMRDLSTYPDFCEQIIVPNEKNIDLPQLLHLLGERQINSLWVEAGARLAGAMIEQNLVDELILYIAPMLLGDSAKGLCHLPTVQQLTQAPKWKLTKQEILGGDIKLTYTPLGKKKN